MRASPSWRKLAPPSRKALIIQKYRAELRDANVLAALGYVGTTITEMADATLCLIVLCVWASVSSFVQSLSFMNLRGTR